MDAVGGGQCEAHFSNLTQKTGGRSQVILDQDSPASSLIQTLPVVDPMQRIWPEESQSRQWR
jgi:hypothetical protein